MSEKAVRESVVQQLGELLALAEKREGELSEELARSKRDVTELRRALKALDGTLYARRNGKPAKGRSMIGVAKLQAITEWLQAHRSELGETFNAGDVYEHPDYDLGSKAALWAALPRLQETGVIRLDHLGTKGPRKVKTKQYALV